jgi:Zn finger protein HypA/HybF involved in hydrogenase expression
MHETSLVKGLIRMVEVIARQQGAPKIKAVKVIIGALSPVSPDYLQEQFRYYAMDTVAEQAELLVRVDRDPTSPIAHDVMLESVEVEDILPRTVSPYAPLETVT